MLWHSKRLWAHAVAFSAYFLLTVAVPMAGLGEDFHYTGGFIFHKSEDTHSSPPSDNSSTQAVDPAEAQRRAEAEQARREEEARKKAEEEKLKKEQFEAEKQDALRSLKGVSTVEPGLKGLTDCQDESCDNDMNFFDYHERQTERREILANLNKNLAIDKTLKPRVDWCKLHIPLPPSPAGACYCDKRKPYEDRMDTWRAKCAAAAVSIPVKKSGKQRSASFCLSAYDTAVSACDGNHFEMASCINKAIGVYIRCLGEENQESGVPLK